MNPNEGISPNRFAGMESFFESVFTEKEEKNCIGLVLFKPDAMAPFLDGPIEAYMLGALEEMTGNKAAFFAHTILRLSPNDVRALYSDKGDQPYLRFVEEHLTSAQVGVALVVAENAPEVLNNIKGSIKTGKGVRGRFALSVPLDQETLLRWQRNDFDKKTQDQLGIEICAANLIHIPDDREETKKAIELIFSKTDLRDLISAVPLFKRWYYAKGKE